MPKKRIRRTKATLRSLWWRKCHASIRHCYACGGRLKSCFVKAEHCRRKVCSKCGVITYVNPKVVAGVIPVMPDGRVALLKRNIEPARGMWSHPAGFMEMGEDIAAAAAREALEEICVPVRVTRFLGVYSYADAGVVTVMFVGRVLNGARPAVSPEAQDVGLFGANEIPWNKLAFRSTVHALKDWAKLSKLKGQ